MFLRCKSETTRISLSEIPFKWNICGLIRGKLKISLLRVFEIFFKGAKFSFSQGSNLSEGFFGLQRNFSSNLAVTRKFKKCGEFHLKLFNSSISCGQFFKLFSFNCQNNFIYAINLGKCFDELTVVMVLEWDFLVERELLGEVLASFHCRLDTF